MKKKIITCAVVILSLGFPVYAQSIPAAPTWKTLGGFLLPINSVNGLEIPQLGGHGVRCLQTDNNGAFSVATGACGSGGGGSGGGTWGTTTSNVSGELINYSLNNTDIVTIGNTATTSAPYFFDPNTFVAYLKGKVGISTTSPYAALSVVGASGVVADHYFATTTTATSTFSGGLSGQYGLFNNGLGVTGAILPTTNNTYVWGNVSMHPNSIYTENETVANTIATAIVNANTKVTTLNASSTNFSTTYASSTLYYGANLASCNGATNALTWASGQFGCNSISGGSGTVTSVDLSVPSGFTVSGNPITTSGTLALGFSAPANSVLVSTSAGTGITATSGPTVNYITATSTTATSTFAGPIRFGHTAAASDNGIQIDCSDRVYPASVTTGGCVRIANGTVNSGPMLELTTGFGSGATGRGLVINATNSAFDQDLILASSSAGNTTTLGLKGTPTGKGIIKVDMTAAGTGFSNSSALSIDKLQCLDCQGIFGDSTTGANTGKWIQFKTQGTNVFDVLSTGWLGISSTTPGTDISIGASGSNSINISSTATSTFGSGINIRTGCFSINGVCVSGSGGGGSGTVNSGTTNQMAYYTGSTAVSSSGFITNLNSANWLGIGTTTPDHLLTISTSTGQHIVYTNTNTQTGWAGRVTNDGKWNFGTTTGTTNNATSSVPTMQLSGGAGALSSFTLATSSTASATSTIFMGKIQIDGYSNTGTRVCAMVIGTSLTVVSGACIQ